MTDIVRTDPATKYSNLGNIVWETRHYCADGSTFSTWERDEFRGMNGLFNQHSMRGLLGYLHPNCIRCNKKGFCRTICPIESPAGFTCTADMGPELQEMGWPQHVTS